MRLVEIKPFTQQPVSHLVAAVEPPAFAWVAGDTLAVKIDRAKLREIAGARGRKISCLAISADATIVVAGYQDGTLRVWKGGKTDAPAWEPHVATKPIDNIAFLSARELVISSDKLLVVWAIGRDKPRVRTTWASPIRGLAVSPQGELAIAGTGRSMAVARVRRLGIVVTWRDGASWADAVHGPWFIGDGEYLMHGTADYEHTYRRTGPGTFTASGSSDSLRGGTLAPAPFPEWYAHASVGKGYHPYPRGSLKVVAYRPDVDLKFDLGEGARRLAWSGPLVACVTNKGRMRLFSIQPFPGRKWR